MNKLKGILTGIAMFVWLLGSAIYTTIVDLINSLRK